MTLNVHIWMIRNLGERSWTWVNMNMNLNVHEGSERLWTFMNNVHEWCFEWAVLYVRYGFNYYFFYSLQMFSHILFFILWLKNPFFEKIIIKNYSLKRLANHISSNCYKTWLYIFRKLSIVALRVPKFSILILKAHIECYNNMQRKLRDSWGNDPGEKHIQVRYTPLNFFIQKFPTRWRKKARDRIVKKKLKRPLLEHF